MSKHSRKEYWHKKKGKGASVNAMARHASIQNGRPAPNPGAGPGGAAEFIRKLKLEIRKATQ